MKPDRFEYLPDSIGVKHEDDALLNTAIANLLRREHRAVVRLVKKRLKELACDDYPGQSMYELEQLLAALAKRRGTR